MEHGHCRDGGNSIAAQLSQLVTITTVDINKSVHIADTEPLDMRLGVQLPLRAEATPGEH
jgi:hypothetical protein